MIPAKRRHLILEYIREHDFVAVEELSEHFDISIPTVHRDLNHLQKEGLLQKVRGGAISQTNKVIETSYQNRSQLYQEEKQRIAKYALRFISDDMFIMLDNSTTVLTMARMLGSFSGLTVITYFEQIIQELARPGYQVSVVSTGGELDRTHMTLIGPIVEATLKDMRVPIAFISTNAISPTFGIMHPHSDESRRKQLIMQAAEEVVLLADHSKFEKTALHVVATLGKIKRIVTDRELDAESMKLISDQGVEVHIADDL